MDMNLTALLLCPGQKPERITFPHELREMQKIVGGNIEAIYPFEDDAAAIICNEEGKLLGLEPNRAIRDPETGELLDILCGTCFICGLGEDGFCSLTEEQLLRYERMYQHPEIFLWNGSRLLVLEVN